MSQFRIQPKSSPIKKARKIAIDSSQSFVVSSDGSILFTNGRGATSDWADAAYPT
jgi:hypothetical protein